MDRTEVFAKIGELCRDVFGDEELTVTEATAAADVEGWDSLAHLLLVNEIEKTFSVALTLDEMSKSKNLGELVDAVMKRLG